MRIFSLIIALLISCSGCIREPGASNQTKLAYHPAKPVLVRIVWADYGSQNWGTGNDHAAKGWNRTAQADVWGWRDGEYVVTDAWVGREIDEGLGWPFQIYAIEREHGATGKVIWRQYLYGDPLATGAYTTFEKWKR
jgi:hypothetical protein